MRLLIGIIGIIALSPTVSQLSYSQEAVTVQDYQRAEKFLGRFTAPLVRHGAVNPNWIGDGRMWYRNVTAEGTEFILVDPAAQTRTLAFDHQRLANALSSADKSFEAFDLPFSKFSFGEDEQTITFSALGREYTCSLNDYVCTWKEKKESELPESGSTPSGRNRSFVVSPNGKLAAFIRDHNLWTVDLESDQETQLTFDGIKDYGYATNNAGWTKGPGPVVLWSPDSKRIATFQHDSRGVGEMYMLSTKSGHQALSRWKYPLPGDEHIFRISRVVIHLDGPRVVRLNMGPDPHRSTTIDHIAGRGGKFLDVRWSKDSSSLAFASSSRDHKTATLRVADPETGEVRDVMQESSETYFESGQPSGSGYSNWFYLPESKEVIWFSERDNWGHLYLYDVMTGKIKNRITQGDWAVQKVRYVDRENRKIYFVAGGREPGDPYLERFYRVDMDGSNLRLLTPESAHHEISMSPDHKYFVDSYSTPVSPPITVVRDIDGTVVVKLESADISELVSSGWQPPIPIKTKARDGQTDIYGLMYRPTHFDPAKKYPVLNPLYPGPQSGSVGSRRFSASRSDKQAVAELGFIVIEVDAMGTPGRSKSFHDAYYGNMGDNGLPDQVAAIKQLGAKYDWMDLDRVGIYGGSGGGFASTAGILRYPDFYKVAVSGSGNHDNASYEDDWGEKWQGLLTRNEDGSSNYDGQANHLLVDNLKGKLLLGHGSLDSNVPINNTMLVVQALIKANKDFDLLVFPDAGHGLGEYWVRRRWDYFVRHLIGVEPPKEFKFSNNQR